MPIGYLITTAIIAFSTLCAVAPVRRRSLGLLSFRFGLPAAELPFLVFAYLAAATVLVVVQSGVSPAGDVGLALAGASALGLAVVVRRMATTRPTVERALRNGLGDPNHAARPGVPVAYALMAPIPLGRRDVERLTNIRYGDAGEHNLLDVYRSRSRPEGCPTLLHLHGGRFVSGRKSREALPLLYRLASLGWVCVSANYRIGPAVRFPDHLMDVKKAIAWLRNEGRAYGVDPGRLVVAGSSAGAHLSAFAALTPNDPAFQSGFERAETSVSAAVCLHGYYGPLDGEMSSPLGRTGAQAPPFFIAHGDLDTIVPVESARLFANALRGAATNRVVYVELSGAGHAFDLFHTIRFDRVIAGIETFVAQSVGLEARPS